VVIGRARNISDERLYDNTTLVALLAWVGLGADGLSSSCYGPEAAFLALGSHTYLSLFVALASILTIVVICASYSQIIEAFPSGGGGYLVASKLLSPTVGVVSGCALIGDYVLTIAISVASGTDALFSMLPVAWVHYKLPGFPLGRGVSDRAEFARGQGIGDAVGAHIFPLCVHPWLRDRLRRLRPFRRHAVHRHGAWPRCQHGDLASRHVGRAGLVILRAYSLGAGTYTGIEAVSNGLNACANRACRPASAP
jgi:hypothetical protein